MRAIPTRPFQLVGVIYLPPLPGAFNYPGTPIGQIAERAVADALALADAGFDAAIIQNANDVPAETHVSIGTLTALTVIADRVRRTSGIPLGICVAHNDGAAAIAISNAVGATFVRIKVLTGVAIGAAGIVSGCATEVARLRRELNCQITVLADVNEVTSRYLGFPSPIDQARQHIRFGGADGVIVTDKESALTALDTITAIKSQIDPDAPAFVGGRVTQENIRTVRSRADGAIVATAIRNTMAWSGCIDPVKAAALGSA